MEAPPAPATGGLAAPKLSTVALLAMAIIGAGLLVVVFAYILVFAQLAFDARLWWMGFASTLFALGFFMLYASTHDRRIARPMAGAFFLIGAGSFYGSIFANLSAGGSQALNFVWIIILSILVIIVLGAIFLMARDSEADAARRAKRKVTP